MNSTGESSGTCEGEQDERLLKVVITLNHAKKEFTYAFEGEWRGRDVKYIIRHIFREYQRYMKTRRDMVMPIAARQAASKQEMSPEAPEVAPQETPKPKQRKQRKKENGNA